MRRGFRVLGFRAIGLRALAILLACCLALAAQQAAAPPITVPEPGRDNSHDPSILRITVVEGEGAVYPLGGRATRGITVQVEDQEYRPIEGATVTFRLPSTGASGEFPTGGRSAPAKTGADGRANVWGIQWNRTPGPLEIMVMAAKGDARATVVAHATLASAAEASSTSGPAPAARGGHKLLWIVLGVAGAAGAGLAIAGMAAKQSASGTSPSAEVNAPLIGPPTITIGHP